MENILFTIGEIEKHEIQVKLRPLSGHIIILVDGHQFWESSFLKFESPPLKIGKTEVNKLQVKLHISIPGTGNFYQWKNSFKKTTELFKILGVDFIFNIFNLWNCQYKRAHALFFPKSDSVPTHRWCTIFVDYCWFVIQ